MPELSYNEAKQLMDSGLIEKNHQVLDNTFQDVEESELLCENPEIELNQMTSEIFYIPPDFLMSPKNPKLITLKETIEEYKVSFESISKEINKFVNDITKSLKKLNPSTITLKNNISEIIQQFENIVINLCTPLISEKQGLDSINIDNLSEKQKEEFNEDKLTIKYKIEEFITESTRLNKNYNQLFNQIYKCVQYICEIIKNIPSTITEFQNEIEEAMSKYEEYLEGFNDEHKCEEYLNRLTIIKKLIILISKKKKKY